MMRCAKGTYARRNGMQIEAGDRVNERRLDALLLVKRRKYAWQAFCQHALARTGRPNEQSAVPACRRNRESTHSELLADDITIIELLDAYPSLKRVGRRERRRSQLGKMIDAYVVEPAELWHARRIGCG